MLICPPNRSKLTMSDKLDQLRAKLRGMQVRINNEEKRLLALRNKAAAVIADIESQEAVVKSLRKEMHDIEDEILRQSGL